MIKSGATRPVNNQRDFINPQHLNNLGGNEHWEFGTIPTMQTLTLSRSEYCTLVDFFTFYMIVHSLRLPFSRRTCFFHLTPNNHSFVCLQIISRYFINFLALREWIISFKKQHKLKTTQRSQICMVQIFDPLLGIHYSWWEECLPWGEGNPDSLNQGGWDPPFPAVTCIGIWVGSKSTVCE